VRDNALVQRLCRSLENILGDTPLDAKYESYFLERFSPRLEVDPNGREVMLWTSNPSESQVSVLLKSQIFIQIELMLAQ
jgi:hypothetical protein